MERAATLHYIIPTAGKGRLIKPERDQIALFYSSRRRQTRCSRDWSSDVCSSDLVSMLYAIVGLKECGVEIEGKINLVLVPDEETGGARGSARLAEQGIPGGNGVGMLLAEPTSGVVWNANRGAISLHVRVFGKSAHVGLQHQGENAFERMHHVVERLQELKREVEQRTTTVNVGTGQSRNSILMLGGQSGGGTNFNVVPETCWFTIDRRVHPGEGFRE